ncbi:MAG: hypothetical protein QOF51_2736 [Chloroflexota bacterium]|nr:hypothetical protein [Chloroflexota bacterium]
MSRSKLAFGGGGVLGLGIAVVVFTALFEFLLFASDPAFRDAPVRTVLADRYPFMLVIEVVGGGICAAGAGGLLAAGLWSANDVRLAWAQKYQGRSLAGKVQGFLRSGRRREEIHDLLLASGLSPQRVEEALGLDWPLSTPCPTCGAMLRAFTQLNARGKRWYTCLSCGWVGNDRET